MSLARNRWPSRGRESLDVARRGNRWMSCGAEPVDVARPGNRGMSRGRKSVDVAGHGARGCSRGTCGRAAVRSTAETNGVQRSGRTTSPDVAVCGPHIGQALSPHGMSAIDSVLRLLVQQGGTELRLESDQRPRMFRDGTELPLTMPAMSSDAIRGLLDDLWTAHAATVAARGQARIRHRSAELGAFTALLAQRGDGPLQATFRVAAEDASAATPPPPAAATRTGAVPDALQALLAAVVPLGASDVHLGPRRPPIARVNGVLQEIDGAIPVDAASLLDGERDGERLRSGSSVDRAFDVAGLGRVRVNVYASSDGLCAAVRILARQVPELAALNLPPAVAELVDLPHGLVIACGPTGSGKSTTLAALIQHALRARPRVLVTLEDPIEYVIRPMQPAGIVRQREVGAHVRDFATGLRDALREDPDILLVGEMRDPETIGLALTAAETGHLVFASLHSRTAMSAVERIVDTYPPERQRQIRVQLADALRAVLAQRLVPSADGRGRLPAAELLRVNHAVANLIREGRTAQIVNALQAGGNEGMLVLERHLAELVRAGRIARDTALATANDPGTLADYLR